MNIIRDWQCTPPNEQRQLSSALNQPKDALKEIMPPTIDQFAGVFSKRRDFVDANINRAELADALVSSSQKKGAPEAVIQSCASLAGPNVYLVETGQQPGLLAGPLLTIYKTIHAITLARRMTEESENVFLPAFWNAAEDHDFSEISELNWLAKDGSLQPHRWEAQNRSRPYFAVPQSDLPLDQLLKALQENSHRTGHTDDIFDAIRDASQGAVSYPDFFDRLMWKLFGQDGLIILRPDDRYFRNQAAAYIRGEIENPTQTSEDVNAIGDLLKQEGLSAQIHKREDRASFFLIQEDKRVSVYWENGGFRDEHDARFSQEVMLGLLDRNPETFSPSAVLRPVLQDAVFPVAATVLGPSEISYHCLLHSIYERHAVPRPVVVPRNGFTLVENRHKKWLDKNGIAPDDLRADARALLKTLVKTHRGEEIASAKAAITQHLEEFIQFYKDKAQSIDPTIVKPIEKGQNRIEKEISNLENLLIRREADKHDLLSKQIESIQTALFPDGALQERRLNVFYFLLKYGWRFLDDLKEISAKTEHGSHTFLHLL